MRMAVGSRPPAAQPRRDERGTANESAEVGGSDPECEGQADLVARGQVERQTVAQRITHWEAAISTTASRVSTTASSADGIETRKYDNIEGGKYDDIERWHNGIGDKYKEARQRPSM